MKKNVLLFIVCIMLLTIPKTNILAATKADQANTAYSKWLQDQSSKGYFTIIDINADKTPELLYTENYGKTNTFNFDKGSISVYAYQNGEVVKIGDIINEYGNYSIYYNKKTKQYVSKYTKGDIEIGYTTLSYDSESFEEINCYTQTLFGTQVDYTANGQVVDKVDYYKYTNSKYNIFDGAKFNSSKFQIVKHYINSSKNRKKVLSK